MYSWIWLSLLVVLILIECCTLNLTTIWFACGSLIAFIASLCGDNLLLELFLFVGCSLAFFFLLRPSALRRFNKKRSRTNLDATIGQTVTVLETVDNIRGTGRARLNGMEWTARSESDSVIYSVGELASIVRIEGVKLILTNKED